LLLGEEIELPIDPSTAFVSYSREDLEFVLRLAKDIKAKGAKVWMDKLDIGVGEDFRQAIQKSLIDCSRVLVVLSSAFVDSPEAQAEVNFALAKGKKIVPLLYRQCEIPYRLFTLQYTDFTRDYADGLEILLSALGVEQQHAAEVAIPVSPRPGQPDVSDTEERQRATELAQAQAEERKRLEEIEESRVAARLEANRSAIAAQSRLEEERKQRELAEAERKQREEEAEAARLAAESNRMQREQAEAAKLAALTEAEHERKATEEKAWQQELVRQRAAGERARLEEEKKQTAERESVPKPPRLVPPTYPAWMKVGIVCAILVVGWLVYWASSRSVENGGKAQMLEPQATQQQEVLSQMTSPPSSDQNASNKPLGAIQKRTEKPEPPKPSVLAKANENLPSLDIKVNPLSLDFPEQTVNTSSSARTITLRNVNSVSIGFSISKGAQDFQIDNGSCNGSLKAGEHCEIRVRFSPITVGRHQTHLEIATISKS